MNAEPNEQESGKVSRYPNGASAVSAAVAGILLTLSACSSDLSEAGAQIRIIVAPDKLRPGMVEDCRRVKDLAETVHGGTDQMAEAMTRSLNDTAAAGGNAYSFTNEIVDSQRGTIVYGTAWQCTRMVEVQRPQRLPHH